MLLPRSKGGRAGGRHGFPFNSGHVHGDARRFDLENAKHLGGVAFDVRNSADFKGRTVDLRGALESDWEKNLRAAIKTSIQGLIPDARF